MQQIIQRPGYSVRKKLSAPWLLTPSILLVQVWLNTEAVAVAEAADHRGSRRRRGFAKRLAKTLHAW